MMLTRRSLKLTWFSLLLCLLYSGMSSAHTTHGNGNVTLVHMFPSSPWRMDFTAGQVAECLIGLKNEGLHNITVGYVDGMLVHATNYNYLIQNFTRLEYGYLVPPDDYQTISYKFMPDRRLESTMPLGLTIRLIYLDNTANEWYMMLVYNGSIQIIEPIRTTPDFQLYSLYLIFAGLTVLIFWMFQRNLNASKKKRKTTLKTTETMSDSKKSRPEDVGSFVKSSSHKSFDIDWVPEHIRSNIAKPRKQ